MCIANESHQDCDSTRVHSNVLTWGSSHSVSRAGIHGLAILSSHDHNINLPYATCVSSVGDDAPTVGFSHGDLPGAAVALAAAPKVKKLAGLLLMSPPGARISAALCHVPCMPYLGLVSGPL